MKLSVQCVCISAFVTMVSVIALTIAAFLIARSASGSLLHAECEVEWKLPISCDLVRSGLVDMMGEWAGDDTTGQEKCGVVSDTCPSLPCGQRCLYKYKADESTESKVSGVHLTPAKHYSDSFNFQLAPTADNAGCKVKGYSSSDLWYAVLDFGTNFCNLRNLLDGAFEMKWEHPDNIATLDDWEGFEEDTNNSKCTQYSSRDCTRY